MLFDKCTPNISIWWFFRKILYQKSFQFQLLFSQMVFLELKRAGTNDFYFSFVMANSLHFEKRMFYHKFLHLRKCPQKRKIFQKFVKICHNYVQHERVLKVFLLSYFEYCKNLAKYSYNNRSTKKRKKFSKNLPKFITTPYNMKGCLKFSTFIFWISLTLAKYLYGLITTWATSQNF
jgi:hypothetical protein